MANHGLSETVYDVLKDNHPPRHADDSAFVLEASKSSVNFHPVLFDSFDAALIRFVT